MIYLDAGATTLQKPPAGALCGAERHAPHGDTRARRASRPPCAQPTRSMTAAVLAGALFDAQPEQVVFTMNATHALNLAIKTLVQPGGRAVISGFEHNAVVRPLHHHRRGDHRRRTAAV